MSIEALQDYTRIARYARYNKELGRRETWAEQVTRVMDMHRTKFADKLEGNEKLQGYFQYAEKAMLNNQVLGSQRALQFGGPSILKNEARLYNCTVSYADRPRFFQEAMYLLLSGCGVGFSVQEHHVALLPNIKEIAEDAEKVIYQIPDSIEGWSDMIGIILGSYFETSEHQEYFGKNVEFDYSLIRPEGSLISNTNGKAPGPEPLKNAEKKIRKVIEAQLQQNQTRLRSIDVYDIVMHSSDAVLAGGVRRSATICMFSKTDNLMMKAKTGTWFIDNPQRGRSNNSVVLLRSETSKEEFDEIMKSVKEFGEPGFVWADSLEALYNPCVTGDTLVTTDKGQVKIKDLVDNTENVLIKSFNEKTKEFELKPLKYALKTKANVNVIKIEFEDNTFLKCTPDHKIYTTDGWVEAGKLTTEHEIISNEVTYDLVDLPERSDHLSYIETEKWNNRIIESNEIK